MFLSIWYTFLKKWYLQNVSKKLLFEKASPIPLFQKLLSRWTLQKLLFGFRYQMPKKFFLASIMNDLAVFGGQPNKFWSQLLVFGFHESLFDHYALYWAIVKVLAIMSSSNSSFTRFHHTLEFAPPFTNLCFQTVTNL